jgi:hypothetical protein
VERGFCASVARNGVALGRSRSCEEPDDDRAAVGLGARVDFERGRERVRLDVTRGDCERVSDAELPSDATDVPLGRRG